MSGYKYEVVAQWLKNRIDDGAFTYGEKMPSENQICLKFKISRQSARKAYEVLIEENYVYSIHGSGYFVKKNLGGRSQKLIGIIISYMADHMYPSILLGLQESLMNLGYAITLGITQNQFSLERKCLLSMLETNQISGLIVEGTKSALPNPNLDLYNQLRKNNIPIVFIHNFYSNFDAPAIMMDDVKAGYELTNMLLNKRHTYIGGIFKFDDLQGHNRFKGYAKALIDAGLPVEDNLISWFSSNPSTWAEGLYDIDIQWSVFEHITGLVTYNDMLAEELLSHLNRVGIFLPRDISIVGFDDQNTQLNNGYYLTSVRHPRKLIGEKSANLIVDILEGSRSFEDREHILIPARIIERDSILPCKKTNINREVPRKQ